MTTSLADPHLNTACIFLAYFTLALVALGAMVSVMLKIIHRVRGRKVRQEPVTEPTDYQDARRTFIALSHDASDQSPLMAIDRAENDRENRSNPKVYPDSLRLF